MVDGFNRTSLIVNIMSWENRKHDGLHHRVINGCSDTYLCGKEVGHAGNITDKEALARPKCPVCFEGWPQ